MNVLSLFDGMSCGQIALERAGIKVDKYFASETDKSAINITRKNYPNTILLGDVTKVHYALGSFAIRCESGSWIDLPPSKIDLLIGGSPCQGFSFAGKGLNFSDPRSRLFFEYVRLLRQIKTENPDLLFLLENVKMKKRWQDVISKELGVEPIKINSSLVSAHMRQRLYWTNIPGVIAPDDKGIKMSDILEEGYYSTRDKSYCIDANYNKGTNFRRYFFCGSRQLVLESGYYPQGITKETANAIMHRDGNRWRKLTPVECERLQTVPENYTAGVSAGERYRMLGNGWTVDVIAHIFSFIQSSKKSKKMITTELTPKVKEIYDLLLRYRHTGTIRRHKNIHDTLSYRLMDDTKSPVSNIEREYIDKLKSLKLLSFERGMDVSYELKDLVVEKKADSYDMNNIGLNPNSFSKAS